MQKKGIEEVVNITWSDKDIEELKVLISRGKSIEYLSKYFNKSENAVECKAYRLNLKILRDRRRWSDTEVSSFKEDWYDTTMSKAMLVKKYQRSYKSIKRKAISLKLGARPYNDEYLTINTISEEMNIPYGRVRNWLNLGLKYKSSRTGNVKFLIDCDDLLNFLEEHQDLFNASKVSSILFVNEPEWFKSKRISDSRHFANRLHSEYTNEEDKQIEDLFKKGFSDKEIAIRLKRSESAIKYHLNVLGYGRHHYNDYEIDILKENSRYLTLDELAKLLPLRTTRGIEYKCRDLGIPYHISKESCESRVK